MNAGKIMAEAFVDELSKRATDNEAVARNTERALYSINSVNPTQRQKRVIREMATADMSGLSPSAKKLVAKAKAAGKTPLEHSRSEQRVKLTKKNYDRLDDASAKIGKSSRLKAKMNKLFDSAFRASSSPKIEANPDYSGRSLEKRRAFERNSRTMVKKMSEAAKQEKIKRIRDEAQMLRERRALKSK